MRGYFALTVERIAIIGEGMEVVKSVVGNTDFYAGIIVIGSFKKNGCSNFLR